MSTVQRTYTDLEIKKELRLVERKLIKHKHFASGGSFSYEDIANEAVALVIHKNLSLACAYQQACWLRLDKIRHAMCSRKRGPNNTFITAMRPLPVSINSTGKETNDTIASTIEDKSRNAEKTLEAEDFKQLLKCLPIPAGLKAVLEDVYLHGLSLPEAARKNRLSPNNAFYKFKRWKPKIAAYLQETGRYTPKLKELVTHVDSPTP